MEPVDFIRSEVYRYSNVPIVRTFYDHVIGCDTWSTSVDRHLDMGVILIVVIPVNIQLQCKLFLQLRLYMSQEKIVQVSYRI